MTPVSLDRLANEIAKPGFERELLPLIMYRGAVSLGRAHRLWNLSLGMMMHDVDRLSARELQMDPDWSKLCFPERQVQNMGMVGFFSRLRLNPAVTDLVPGFTEYVEWMLPRPFHYEAVSPISHDRRSLGVGGWREFVYKKRLYVPKPRLDVSLPVRAYPFLIHEAKRPEHELLMLVNRATPAHLPPEMRADMCQDLAVGVLTGEFAKDDLYLPSKEVAKRVYRMFPTKYGPLSIDAPLTSDGDFSILDTLVDEGRDWA